MDKKELRNHLRSVRNSLTNEEIIISSAKITEQVMASSWFLDAKTVLLYRSANSEVLTDALWKACLNMGKICLFPKCISKTEMIAVMAEKESDFSPSRYGIMEPVSDLEYDKSNIDLILVPGLGFDEMKYRIGYGAGYYDRYLQGYSGVTCGLSYQKTFVKTVFPKIHDISLSYVATEHEII